MELSEYVTKLRTELGALTRFAGEDMARAAELLAPRPASGAAGPCTDAVIVETALRFHSRSPRRAAA